MLVKHIKTDTNDVAWITKPAFQNFIKLRQLTFLQDDKDAHRRYRNEVNRERKSLIQNW